MANVEGALASTALRSRPGVDLTDFCLHVKMVTHRAHIRRDMVISLIFIYHLLLSCLKMMILLVVSFRVLFSLVVICCRATLKTD